MARMNDQSRKKIWHNRPGVRLSEVTLIITSSGLVGQSWACMSVCVCLKGRGGQGDPLLSIVKKKGLRTADLDGSSMK